LPQENQTMSIDDAGCFPILDQCVKGRWKLIYGELMFQVVGEPMPQSRRC
jgi:hypothetical protein